jgi:hypothetical protein
MKTRRIRRDTIAAAQSSHARKTTGAVPKQTPTAGRAPTAAEMLATPPWAGALSVVKIGGLGCELQESWMALEDTINECEALFYFAMAGAERQRLLKQHGGAR